MIGKKSEKETKERSGYLKILKKSKESILIYHPAIGKEELKWDDFNKMYEINPENPHRAFLKKEYKEKFDKVHKIMNETCVYFMMSQNEKDPIKQAAHNVTFMKQMEEVVGILGCSMAVAINLFRDTYNRSINGMLEMGIGFGELHHKMMSKEQIAKSDKNIERIRKESEGKKGSTEKDKSDSEKPKTPKDKFDDGCSIGDMLKARGQKLSILRGGK